MRKSFMFYLSWKELINSLTDDELRRFINNLVLWHQNEDIVLTSKSESAIWSLIEPALIVNDEKWNSRASSSRENGKLGGRPSKPEKTKQVIEKPKKPVNSKILIDKGEKKIDESKLMLENSNEKIDKNSIPSNSNEGQSLSSYYKSKINNIESILTSRYPQFPYLLSMANPSGIKELQYHIENPDDLNTISFLLRELSESRYRLTGNYN